MDPISTAASLLSILISLKAAYDGVKSNKAQCKTLVSRLQCFSEPLKALSKDKTKYTSLQLHAMHDIITEADGLVGQFSRKNFYQWAESIAAYKSWAGRFADLNVRITQVSGDLSLAVAVSNEERRRQDLDDHTHFMQGMASQVMDHMKAENDVTSEELGKIQQEIKSNYRHLVRLVLSKNTHSEDLSEDENAAVGRAQDALLIHTEQQFGEIMDGIQQMQSDLNAVLAKLEEGGLVEKRRAKLQELIISPSEVAVNLKLDAGGMASVFLGKFKRNTVALKILENKNGTDLTSKQREDVENEVLIMRMVAEPNILFVHGFVNEPQRMIMVLELAALGSLWNMLNNFHVFPDAAPFPPSLVVAWISDLAYGAAHLHSKCVRHKDLKVCSTKPNDLCPQW